MSGIFPFYFILNISNILNFLIIYFVFHLVLQRYLQTDEKEELLSDQSVSATVQGKKGFYLFEEVHI